MATIPTLASMMLQLPPKIDQYDPLEVLRQQNVAQGGRLSNQTALITLEDLKRQQATAQEARQFMQQNPAQMLGGGGGPLLASPALTAGGGPMTQQPFGPGGMGPPQQVPGGQDLSRYAGVSPQGGGPIPPDVAAQLTPQVTPPGGAQSTLAGLAPQPRQDPLQALMARNPDAALQVMQTQLKLQEQRLGMGEKIAGSIGRIAQGINDQASLDQARQDIGQIDPRAAAQLPQFYSKAALEPFIQRALSVEKAQTLKIADLQAQAQAVKAQADLAKARMSGRVAKTDQYLKALGVAPGQETAQDMEKALAWQQRDEIAVSQMQGAGQLKDTALGVTRVRPGGDVEFIRGPNGEILQPKPSDTMERAATLGNLADSANKTANTLEDKGLRPGVWEKGMEALPLGMGNYLVSSDYQKYRQAVTEFAQAWLYKTSGAQVTKEEWERTNQTYFPQPGEDKEAVEQKRQKRAALVEQLRQEAKGTGRMGTQGQSTSQTSLKPVTEMSSDELLAEKKRILGGR